MSCEALTDAASGLKKYRLQAGGAAHGGFSAEVFEHGAHVTSWRDAAGNELLFVSKEAVFKPPKAIRGGIPVCWPQFSDFGPLGQHGFARNMAWELVSSGGASAHGAFVELGLRDSEATLAAWPHAFALRLRVSLSDAGTLRQDVTVRNTGPEALRFTFALHTYFRVADVAKASVRGLAGTPYLDSLQARARFTEEAEAIVFDKEVDRIYVGVPSTLTLADEGACRSFALATRGLPDAIVWNPWVAKAAAMADFGDEEYKQMVCIEAAAVERAVVVAPGEQWEGGQTLSVDTLPSRR